MRISSYEGVKRGRCKLVGESPCNHSLFNLSIRISPSHLIGRSDQTRIVNASRLTHWNLDRRFTSPTRVFAIQHRGYNIQD
jgi:hypothetical protein